MWAFNPYTLQSACRVYAAYNMDIPNIDIKQIEFDTAVYDLANEFNLSTHYFVAKKSGKYHFDVSITLKSDNDIGIFWAHFYRGTTLIHSHTKYNIPAGYNQLSFSCDINLSANNSLYIECFQVSGHTITIQGGYALTFLNASKLD